MPSASYLTGVAGLLRQRRRRVLAPGAMWSRFDWLEGATGVYLMTGAGNQGSFVSVTGEVDQASIDVIQTAVRDAIESSTRVELDLRCTHPRDTDRSGLVAWAQARAAERNVTLAIRSAERCSTSLQRSWAREPRNGQRAAGCRGDLQSTAPAR